MAGTGHRMNFSMNTVNILVNIVKMQRKRPEQHPLPNSKANDGGKRGEGVEKHPKPWNSKVRQLFEAYSESDIDSLFVISLILKEPNFIIEFSK